MNLIIAAVVAGLSGAAVGAIAGGVIAAATCEGGLECLGDAVVGVGSGAILVESVAMVVAVYLANRKQGNLFLALPVTLVLAVPIPFLLLLGYAAPLAALLFVAQVWACIRVLRGNGGRRRRRRT
jgi:hypothetical protein